MSRTYLFVYGTLRKDFGLKLTDDLADDLIFAGHGTVSGVLYDLGNYPGAVESATAGKIKGEVYEVTNAENVFRILDEYEGGDYCRKNTIVVLDNKERREAFIYWYTGKTDKAPLIAENDYLDYLKNKKDRFL